MRALDVPWAAVFEHDAAVVYMLDQGLRLGYCNAAWDEFAKNNGGTGDLSRDRIVGTSIMAVIPEPLQHFYQALFLRALRGEPVDHLYECSSADEKRWFHMHVVRIPETAGVFLLVIHSLITSEFMDRPGQAYSPGKFQNQAGLITMCAHCRRILAPGTDNDWVWVPDLVRNMPRNVSHGFCGVCYEIYYAPRPGNTTATGFGPLT